jgi:hypothetical protein
VDFKQLRELYVQSTWKEKKKEDALAAVQAPEAPSA